MKDLCCGPYKVRLFPGDTKDIVYTVMDEGEADEVWRLIAPPRPALAVISGVDWDRDLSPWPAPRAFRGGADFNGGAPEFLNALTEQILPLTDRALGFAPASRGIAGYSLAGLFALWSLYNTVAFDRAASMSGSLWYDGFLDYMEGTPLCGRPKQVYLSLGDREKATKNSRMAKVEDRTQQAAALFREQGIEVIFTMNPGGHFQDAPSRIAKGIDALNKTNDREKSG